MAKNPKPVRRLKKIKRLAGVYDYPYTFTTVPGGASLQVFDGNRVLVDLSVGVCRQWPKQPRTPR